MMAFKVRFPLLLLLGVVFLALVCASASAISSHEGREGLPPRHRESGGQRERAHQEGEREEERRYQPRHHKSQSEEQEEDEEEERQPHHHRPQHKREEDEGRHQREREEDEEDDEGQQHYRPRRHQREREDDEEDQQQRNPRRGQEEEDEEEREHGASRRHRRSRQHAGEREEEQRPSRQRGRGREEDEDEDEEEDRRRPEERERRRRSRESERHRGGRQRRSRESEDDDDGDEEEGSSQDRKNPFLLRSNRFQTLLKNENGQIRLLQRFDKRSNLFENLQNYRLLEYRSKPNTLLLPQHYDADFILVVLRGKAILTVVNPKERNSFNLERGDAIKIPAGTLAYLANRDNEEDLRVVDLAIPVNRPGQFQPFNPSSSENQQSYFRGFSKDILEASFNTNIEEIERVLLQEQQQEEQSHGQGRREQRRGRKERPQQQEGQDEANNNPIVRVSREQIEELSKNAKSSSKKKSESSKSEPFNLRSRDPIYSNKFGQFFQITPKQSPQLKDLDLYLTSVQINEGALLLPHYNSRGTVILVINEGKGNIELVGVRNEQQQEEEEEEDEDDQRSRQVKRYRARVSPGDVFIVPSSHPVAIKASSNLSFVGFGINAENNQRNFLAGEEDNVISQIHKPVKELAFPGSAQDVDKLIKNQKQSYFANAQPEQKEGQKRSRGPLSSILGAFY